MKEVKIIIISSLILFLGCKNKIAETSSKERSSVDSVSIEGTKGKTKMKNYNKDLLDGAWAENEDENALFYIENDSIYYFENENDSYSVDIEKGNLIINYNTFAFEGKILKLTKDSLIYEADTKTIKLYKRVE